MAPTSAQLPKTEWVKFPGGELEGRRPKVLCPACRHGRKPTATLCFQCYRAELDREKALKAAGDLDTASDARFQDSLPFEPVNQLRLGQLKAERAEARAAARIGAGAYVDRRRHAQIAARRALLAIAAGLEARQLAPAQSRAAMGSALHASELQLPDAWLPFVMSR